jgi:hypothetical protein
MFALGHRDHPWRHIDPDRCHSVSREPRCDVAWPAAQVDKRCAGWVLFDERTQQGPVERLVDELVTQLSRVPLGKDVVAAADICMVRTIRHDDRMSPMEVSRAGHRSEVPVPSSFGGEWRTPLTGIAPSRVRGEVPQATAGAP